MQNVRFIPTRRVMAVIAGLSSLALVFPVFADKKIYSEEKVIGPGPNPPPGGLVVRPLHKLVGREVWGASGEKLGRLEEIVVDASHGQVVYGVLSFGGVLGIGGKEFAVPWSALGKNVDMTDYNRISYTLNVDKDRLRSAPGFDKDRWPDMGDANWAGQVYAYWGQRPYWEVPERPRKEVHVKVGPIHVDVEKQKHEPELRGTPVAPEPPRPAGMLVKSGGLVGHALLDQNGAKIGQLKAAMVDPQRGLLVYGILEIKAPGFNSEDRYPVPWRVLDVRSKAGDLHGVADADAYNVVLNVPLPALANGPKFPERDWPNMTPEWGEQVYRAYGIKPFWRE